jgi:hypothetical protein
VVETETTEAPATEEVEPEAKPEEAPVEAVKEEPEAVEENSEEPAKYSLDEIPEYIQLMNAFNALEASYNELTKEADQLREKVNTLTTFKTEVERKEKNDMISKFFMLSDEDKKDVVDNIDKYSVD